MTEQQCEERVCDVERWRSEAINAVVFAGTKSTSNAPTVDELLREAAMALANERANVQLIAQIEVTAEYVIEALLAQYAGVDTPEAPSVEAVEQLNRFRALWAA